MKQNYDKPSVEFIKVCLADVLSLSGGELGTSNFDKNWLTPAGQD